MIRETPDGRDDRTTYENRESKVSETRGGWRTRRSATITNCGRETSVRIWKSNDSAAFHVHHRIRDIGQQPYVALETIVNHDDAIELFNEIVREATAEVVIPPKRGEITGGVIDGEETSDE